MKRLVYVTSIFIIVLMTAGVAWYGINNMAPPKQPVSTQIGSVSEVDLFSQNEVRLTFGLVTGSMDFDRCSFVIFSPGNIEVNTVDLKEERWSYMIKGERITLTTLTIIDVAYDSKLDAGDSISLYHLKSMEKGTWTLRLFLDGKDFPSLEEVFVVPERNETPVGVFRIPQMVSASELILPFGIFDGKVPFYYTSLVITSPDGQERTWEFAQGQPYIFDFNDTIWVNIIDMAEQRIINFNDIVRVQSTSGGLTEGEWEFTLTYDFTSEDICYAEIEVANGQAVLS